MSLFYSSFYRILNSDRSKIEPTLCTKEDSFNVKANIDQNMLFMLCLSFIVNFTYWDTAFSILERGKMYLLNEH